MTPFISSPDLAAYLRLPQVSLLDSDLAAIALDSACQVVRDYCDQALDQETVTDEKLDGTGTSHLPLPSFTVSAVTSVKLYGPDLQTFDALVENTDYVLKRDGSLRRIDGGVWTAGHNNVLVSYTRGNATVPASVRLVALQVAARVYEFGMTEGVSGAGVSEQYVKGAGSLTKLERDVLGPHRRSA